MRNVNRNGSDIGSRQGQESHYQYDQEDMDKNVSQQENSVGWVNTPPPKQHHFGTRTVREII